MHWGLFSGCITLFASAFPLGAAVTLLFLNPPPPQYTVCLSLPPGGYSDNAVPHPPSSPQYITLFASAFPLGAAVTLLFPTPLPQYITLFASAFPLGAAVTMLFPTPLPQYITLFASAFPLGAAVTLLFLYVEVRSDFFKLIKAYRRPLPMR